MSSNEIEIWEFNDGTKITRFNRNNFQAIISIYDGYVRTSENSLFSTKQNIAIKIAGIGLGICLLIGSGIFISNYTNNTQHLEEVVGAGVLGLSGIAAIAASFYPEYKKFQVIKATTNKAYDTKTLWIGVKDIRNMLIEESDKVDQILRDGFQDRSKSVEKIKNLAPELVPLMEQGLKREDL